MTDSVVKVGDVVAWMMVPDGALVIDDDGDYAVHINNRGSFVHTPSDPNPRRANAWFQANGGQWLWGEFCSGDEEARVVALNLQGSETADELRALAEAFHRDHPAA